MRQLSVVRRRGKALIGAAIAFGLLVVLVMIAQYRPLPQIECYVGQTESMSVQEVADLLDTTLAELTWFPDNMGLVTRIRTSPTYYFSSPERSRCDVAIQYVKPASSPANAFAELRISPYAAIQLTKVPTRCSWHFGPDGPIDTDCTADVDGADLTLNIDVHLSPEILPEDALLILEGIQVVEPQENEDAQTN